MLSFGASGDEVKALQEELNRTGADLKVDGYFGYATQFAVRLFQANHGLTDDGIVGPITRKALDEKLKRLANPSKKAELYLVRDIATPNSISGQLFLNGDFMGYTLERPWKNNQRKISCIPAGKYKVAKRNENDSHRFWYEHLMVCDVPKRTLILFHRGNYPEDFKGCIGVGRTRSIDFIGNSRAAFNELMKSLEPFDNIELVIKQA